MIRTWATKTILLVCCVLTVGGLAHGHMPPSLRACPQFANVRFQTSPPMILQSRLLPNGLWAELFDANMDGAPDFATYSNTLELGVLGDDEVPHDSFPILYEIDTDGDAIPNDVWIDVYGKGRCTDLLPYTIMGHDSKAAKVYWLIE